MGVEQSVEMGIQQDLDDRLAPLRHILEIPDVLNRPGVSQAKRCIALLGHEEYFGKEVSSQEIYSTVADADFSPGWLGQLGSIIHGARKVVSPWGLAIYDLKGFGMYRLDREYVAGTRLMPFGRKQMIDSFCDKPGVTESAVMIVHRLYEVEVGNDWFLRSALGLYPHEIRLLTELVRAYPGIASYDQLSEVTRGDGVLPKQFADPFLNSVRVNMCGLRRNINNNSPAGRFGISTIDNHGYRLVLDDS